MSIEIEDVRQLAIAIATANGHTAPPEWADKVIAALNANAPAVQPADVPTQDAADSTQ